ncbi:MAG: type II toxin-antitoxin system HipA family toxin [Granulosicoccaceae bacterium]
MLKKSSSRRLDVLMNGELVGHWTQLSGNRQEFSYVDSWLQSPNSRPLSLSMPLSLNNTVYKNDLVEPYFDNLLPDNLQIKERLQSRVKALSTGAFDLLAEFGMDCVGAVQLVSAESSHDNVRTIQATLLSEQAIEAELRSVTATPILGQQQADFLRLSIAGAQEKTALLKQGSDWYRPSGSTPTTHIIKLPMGKVGNEQADLSTSVENEWLCSKIIAAFGVPIAQCDIATFGAQKALVVERFDRRLSKDKDWWVRIPQEDLCQATATPSAFKYESDGGPGVKAINNLLLGSRTAREDVENFIKAQILFWMLCAPDGHAKNFSIFIEKHGRYTMTPLYDVISAYPIMGKGKHSIAENKIKMAMAMPGRNKHYHWAKVQPRHIEAVAAISGRKPAELIDELCDQTDIAIEAAAVLIPDDFPGEVADRIFSGMSKARDKLGRR